MKKLFFFIILPVLISCTKFCINCKYFIPKESIFLTPAYNSAFAKCGFYPNKITDNEFLITGSISKSQKDEFYYCSTARKFEHLCGESGKHFINQ